MARETLLDQLTDDAVVMFIGAHPDDETTIGPLMAYCGDRCRELIVVSLTRGGSGYNLAHGDLTRTLTQMRDDEFAASVGLLGGTPITFGYTNGKSTAHPDGVAIAESREEAWKRWQADGNRDETPEAAYARWTDEGGDPALTVQKLLREWQPTVVLALDPKRGFTDHREHVTVAQATLAGVKAHRADNGGGARLYYVYNPKDEVEGAERFTTADLVAAGGKDYLTIGIAAKSEYECQYGLKGSETLAASIGDGVQKYQVVEADLG